MSIQSTWNSVCPKQWHFLNIIMDILFYLFLKYILLKYSWFTVLTSAVQQSDSVTHIHTFLTYILFHYGLSQDTEYSFPVLYRWILFFIHTVYNSLHLLIPNSYFIPSPFPLPLGNHKSVLTSVSLFLFRRLSSLVAYLRLHI